MYIGSYRDSARNVIEIKDQDGKYLIGFDWVYYNGWLRVIAGGGTGFAKQVEEQEVNDLIKAIVDEIKGRPKMDSEQVLVLWCAYHMWVPYNYYDHEVHDYKVNKK